MQLWDIRRWSIGLVSLMIIAILAEIGNGAAPLPGSTLIPKRLERREVMHPSQWSMGSFLTKYLEMMHTVIPSDFWERLVKLEDAVRKCTDTMLQKAANANPAAAEQLSKFKGTMDDIVSSTGRLRAEVENAVREHGLSLEDISKRLSEELAIILEGLKEDFPPPSNATRHEQRRDMISRAFSEVEDSLVYILVPYGVSETNIRARFGDVKIPVEQVLVATGDLIEQHPVILETLLMSGAVMLIPEAWLLRPFLSLFGFGPYGPVKGSAAAWAQRRFWGGAVAEGSWFALLQRAGMKWGLGDMIKRFLAGAVAILGSLFWCF